MSAGRLASFAGCVCGSATNGSRKWMWADRANSPTRATGARPPFRCAESARRSSSASAAISIVCLRSGSITIRKNGRSRVRRRAAVGVAEAEESGTRRGEDRSDAGAKPPPVRLNVESAAKTAAGKSAVKNGAAMPANGVELQRRVHDYDARSAQQGVCQAGDWLSISCRPALKRAMRPTWRRGAVRRSGWPLRRHAPFESRLRQQKSERKEVA